MDWKAAASSCCTTGLIPILHTFETLLSYRRKTAWKLVKEKILRHEKNQFSLQKAVETKTSDLVGLHIQPAFGGQRYFDEVWIDNARKRLEISLLLWKKLISLEHNHETLPAGTYFHEIFRQNRLMKFKWNSRISSKHFELMTSLRNGDCLKGLVWKADLKRKGHTLKVSWGERERSESESDILGISLWVVGIIWLLFQPVNIQTVF